MNQQQLMAAGLTPDEIKEIMLKRSNAAIGKETEIRQLQQAGLTRDEAEMIVDRRHGTNPSTLKADPDESGQSLGRDWYQGPAEVIRQTMTEPPPPPRAPATPGDDEVVGPDPQLIQAYELKMRDYEPPKTEETFQVTLPARFADWVRKKAVWEGVRRGREITPEKMIELGIRQLWQHDDDRRRLTAGATGPRSSFNPATGRWE